MCRKVEKKIELLLLITEHVISDIENEVLSDKTTVNIKILAFLTGKLAEYDISAEYRGYFKKIEQIYSNCKETGYLIENIDTIKESLITLLKCFGLMKIKITEQIEREKFEYKEKTDTDKTPLVSVLIPTYERPYFFIQALESAIDQTYENIEIVVSDNGPGNVTEEIMKSYTEVYGNIKYYHLAEGNVVDNWDNCWNKVSTESEYINFLMDDDLFAEDKIELMMRCFLNDKSLSLVTSHRQNIDIFGNYLPDKDFNEPIVKESSIIDGETAGMMLLLKCGNWIGEPTTVLFKKKCAEGRWKGWVGDEGNYNVSDYPLWLRLLEHGNMAYITRTLSYFRQHEDNQSKMPISWVKAMINMALQIQTAWNKKVFLTDSEALRQSILSWFKLSLPVIKYVVDDVDGEIEEVFKDDLIKVYKEFSLKYIDSKPGIIIFGDLYK